MDKGRVEIEMRKMLIRGLGWIIILAIILNMVGNVLRNKELAESIYTYRVEKDNSLDLLLLGSSISFRFISSQELYHNYGIASYNLGTSMQSLSESYYILDYALENQNPELVMLDITRGIDMAYQSNSAKIHVVLDNLSKNWKWMKMAYNLSEGENVIDYLIPAQFYHLRWKDLNDKDFKSINSYSKGNVYNYAITSFENIEIYKEEDSYPILEDCEEYINKIMELCEKKGCKLVFVIEPVPAYLVNSEEAIRRQGMFNSLKDKIGKMGGRYSVLDLSDKYDDMDLDFAMDYSDDKHVNVAGAMKVTNYVGKYLVDNYDLPDRRMDSNYEEWDNKYWLYANEINEYIDIRSSDNTRYYLKKEFNKNKG